MSKEFKIAIVGVKNLKGKTLKEQLEKSKIPLREVYLFDPSVEEEYALLDEFAGEAKVVRKPSKDALEKTDVVFFAADRKTTEELFEGPYISIDLLSITKKARRVVSGINLEELEDRKAANPMASTIGISHVLYPLMKNFGLQRALLVLHEPASEYGEEGMDELFEQAFTTLNMEEVPKKVLKEKLAFNLLPQKGAERNKGFSEKELKLSREIKEILGEKFQFSGVILRSSIFHRFSAMLFVELEKNANSKEVFEALESNRFVRVEKKRGKISPAEMEEGGEFVHVGDIKEAQSDKRAFWLWLVFDNLLVGSALNALDIAYHLLRKRL